MFRYVQKELCTRGLQFYDAGSGTRGRNPTTGLNLLWARNTFRGNFNHWQVSRKEVGKIFFKRQLSLPFLLYGSETWTIKGSEARRITAAEMKYMRRTAGYTWTDYKTNAQIAKELKITILLL